MLTPSLDPLFLATILHTICIVRKYFTQRLNPKVGAVAENADEDGNCDWKYHEQPEVVELSDQLLMGHV